MAKKESVHLFLDNWQIIKDFSDAQKAQILEYIYTKIVPTDAKAEVIALVMQEQQGRRDEYIRKAKMYGKQGFMKKIENNTDPNEPLRVGLGGVKGCIPPNPNPNPNPDPNKENINTSTGKANNSERKGFVKPSLSELSEYIKSKNYRVDPDRFMAHYESVGWKIGKNNMKCWKSSVKTWHYREDSKPKTAINFKDDSVVFDEIL